MNKHKRTAWFKRLLLAVGLGLFVSSSAGVALAQNVPQGYQSDESLQKGMIVRLKKDDGSKVEAINLQEASDMFGVVVSRSDSPVSLSSPGSEQEVLVATTGSYDVLVSNQNGAVDVGDYITVSSIRGVGMKASGVQQLVLGKALKAFSGKNGDVESRATLKTNSGEKEVALGRVPIEVSVAHNPLYEKENITGVPEFLSKAVEVVTDRPVSALRIYAGLAVLALSISVAGGILYAGVRTGMTAAGRNPLAKRSIVRTLIQVTLMSLIVFVIGVFAVYLLLRI
jgi:hypothetical protein